MSNWYFRIPFRSHNSSAASLGCDSSSSLDDVLDIPGLEVVCESAEDELLPLLGSRSFREVYNDVPRGPRAGPSISNQQMRYTWVFSFLLHVFCPLHF